MAMMSDTSEMRTSYAAKTTRRYFVLAVTAALLLISFIVDVSTVPGKYPLSTVVETLLNPMAHGVQIKVIIWGGAYCLRSAHLS